MSETIALIGFGEAGRHIGRGLVAEGNRVRAFDLLYQQPAMTSAALEAGVDLRTSAEAALEGADLVFSLVTASSAVDAAGSASPYLNPGQIYIDFNSVSPKTKLAVATAIKPSKARFVEAAIMAPVPGPDHRVPILIAGSDSAGVAARLNAVGMRVESVGERVGDASLSKMLRSIFIKGIEALMLEGLTAAHHAGIDGRILDSVQKTLPGIDWRALAFYNLGRTVVHGARRAAEMRESAETVAELGMEPFVTEGIAKRIAWAHEQLKDVHWPEGEPKSYEEILEVLATKLARGKREAAE